MRLVLVFLACVSCAYALTIAAAVGGTPVSYTIPLLPTNASLLIIDSNYISANITHDVLGSFNRTRDIVLNTIDVRVPIYVFVYFTEIASINGDTILASGSPTSYIEDLARPQRASSDASGLLEESNGTLSAIALAQNRLGERLSNEYDIFIKVNPRIKWYFDSDSNITASEFDFASVLFHEILHGLGWSGLVYNATNITPQNKQFSDYDIHVVNVGGFSLVQAVREDTGTAFYELGGILYDFEQSVSTGDSVSITNFLLPVTAILYIRPKWIEGMTLYHFDQTTYESSPNSLMLPFFPAGSIIETPGLNGIQVLGSIGWNISLVALGVAVELQNLWTPEPVVAGTTSLIGVTLIMLMSMMLNIL